MMSTRKTDRDIAREDKAHAVNAALLDAGVSHVSVTAGGRRGPYTVTVDRLNEREMRALVEWLARGCGVESLGG